MAEFITKCPHCNNDLQVQDEWDGIEVECPICSKTFTVRKPSPKLVKNNSRTSSARKYYCSNCKKEYPEPVKFCSECGSKIQNKSSNRAKKASSTFFVWFWSIAILIGVPVLLTTWIDSPRTIFWCTLPLWGICLFAAFAYKAENLVYLLLGGMVFFGRLVYKQGKTPTPKETVKTISSNTADSYKSKISVSVIVTKENSYDETWKYGCEYRLYADDQLIATKNSTSMAVQFYVKVEKGASLRAEMLGRNALGAIAKTLEGPRISKTATANYAGETISIECI